jgi:hypothetical protein
MHAANRKYIKPFRWTATPEPKTRGQKQTTKTDLTEMRREDKDGTLLKADTFLTSRATIHCDVSNLYARYETDSCSAGQDGPKLLGNSKVRYHVHKRSPVDPILNQLNLAHILTPYFSKNNLLYSHLSLGLPSHSFQQDFPPIISCTVLISHTWAVCSAHLILFKC